MRFLLRNAPESILTGIVFVSLSASMMSAYTTSQLVIKIIFTLLTAATVFVVRREIPALIVTDRSIRKLLAFSGAINIAFALTLLYTSNFPFGLMKLLNFTVMSVLVALFYIYMKTSTAGSFKIALYTIAIIMLIFIVTSAIISPFIYTTKYSFSIDRWSHIISGRVIAGVIVMFAMIVVSGKDYINDRFAIVFLVCAMFGLVFTGSRLSVITTAITLLLLIAYAFKKQKATSIKIKIASLFFLMAGFFILLSKSNDPSVGRYGYLLEINKDSVKEMIDGAMKSRISGYQTGLKIVTQYPLLGKGIGGFKDDPNYYLTTYLQYPHNIFLEVASEFGLPALALFLAFVIGLLIRSYKKSPCLCIFLIFSLTFAMFSKDIPTQTFFWMGVALYFLDSAIPVNSERSGTTA
ncbi:O-antigen ligase family protein [Ignavibacteria bacterium CHB1]|nr:hypothetical protein [Ignavibacteria bacterium]MDL1887959.1 O-antigen ligase family protein [Ignavibacteria bacterium CHB1]RIK47508.1 MAG: hypothetical protein DCC60_10445 [Ignavibacteriota bacterium]